MTRQELLIVLTGLVLFAVAIVMAATSTKAWLIPMFGVYACSGRIVYQRRMH